MLLPSHVIGWAGVILSKDSQRRRFYPAAYQLYAHVTLAALQGTWCKGRERRELRLVASHVFGVILLAGMPDQPTVYSNSS